MSRRWRTGLAFALAAALLAAMVAAISAQVVRLDREGAEARRRAALEESVRLALWRMDSAFTPVLARESAWTPEDELPPAPQVRLHFRLAGARLESTDAPADPRLSRLRRLLQGDQLARALPRPAQPASRPEPPAQPQRLAMNQVDDDFSQAPTMQAQAAQIRQVRTKQKDTRGLDEWSARAKNVYQSVLANEALSLSRSRRGEQQALKVDRVEDPPQDDEAPGAGRVGKDQPLRNVAADDAGPAEGPGADGVLSPVWVEGELLLARRSGDDIVGAWLDWPAVRGWLLGEVRDLLPGASLAPAGRDAAHLGERLLASLPVQLLPGPLPPGLEPSAGAPIGLVLAAAWLGVLLALAAAGALLAGTVALSERRAAFVSAVTHELRTPLTTVRMYAEMLASGMVSDEPRRRDYLDTLDREASRLGRLVENVLAWSRIEQGRPRAPEPVETGPMLERARPLLVERAQQVGLGVEISDTGAGRAIADEAGVGQILFNLVDNACKYARDAQDKRIEIRAARSGAHVEIEVRDHGPGIPAAVRRRLFVPFSRSAKEAAGSAPGVGLGLALCRRLARAMGGELRLAEAPGGGARFVLRLRGA